ncbi:hypothetical protein SAMN05216364_10973, partial [Porphyromonadaceae bacterium KHP3R9]
AMTLAYEGYRKRMNAQKAIVKVARKLVNRIFYNSPQILDNKYH